MISDKCSISGDDVSSTNIVCGAMAILPEPSIAVQITVVIPSGNDSGELFDKDSIPLSSLALASPMLTCVNPPDASIIISSGTNISGLLKSLGIGLTNSDSTSVSLIFSNSV